MHYLVRARSRRRPTESRHSASIVAADRCPTSLTSACASGAKRLAGGCFTVPFNSCSFAVEDLLVAGRPSTLSRMAIRLPSYDAVMIVDISPERPLKRSADFLFGIII